MNSRRKRFLVLCLACLFALTAFTGCGSKESGKTSKGGGSKTAKGGKEQVTLDFLMCWNGASSQFPEDMKNNPISKELAKKTGVTLNVETITTDEGEKLSTIFGSGEVPDIVNAPYWDTNPGSSGDFIRKAATEGLVLELDPYMDKYPNVKRMMTEGVSESYKKYDLEHPDYNGKHYIIPQQTPRTDDDVTQWAYNVWIRQDILKDLGVEPESIDSSEKLYELMKQIKGGGFKDINGKPVIPAGTWGNGWNYSDFLKSFSRDTVSDWRNLDGKITHWIFDPMEDKKVLFMRKLVSEGLFDPEAYTQTDTVAKEKIATGRVAVLNGHYPNLRDFMRQTLYKTNPEMKYVPVGPFLDADGKHVTAKESRGRTGSPAIFLSSKCKNPEKALEFIDYINSDEGLKLVTFGMEGVHYNMLDGKPQRKDEWQDKKETDMTAYVNEGLVFGDNFVGADPRKGWWPEKEDPDYEKAKEVTPLEFYDGINANFIARDYPSREEYENNTAALDYGKEFMRATFEDTDEGALKILNDYRKKLKDAGLDKFIEYMQKEIPKVKNIRL